MPSKVREKIGRWRVPHSNRFGTIVSDRPLCGERRLSDENILECGGPYMVCESINGLAAAFFSRIPDFIMDVEEIAFLPCTCCAAMLGPCGPCRARSAVDGMLSLLGSPTEDTEKP
jgi:hypothetical protein